MFGYLATGTLLIAVGMGIQRWSTWKRRDRKQVKQVDVPRWEDEGGAPRPEPAEQPGPEDDPMWHGDPALVR